MRKEVGKHDLTEQNRTLQKITSSRGYIFIRLWLFAKDDHDPTLLDYDIELLLLFSLF